MGRNKRLGGGYTIHNAEQLFEQSKADGKPDYRYVALAIGNAPASPPTWAICACIDARQEEEQKVARGVANDIPAILDEIVRFYERSQIEFERENRGTKHTLDDYFPPALQSAILWVLNDKGLRQAWSGSAETDWFKDIRRAWDWEQEHELAPSSYMQLEPMKTKTGNERGKERAGLYTTRRIDRVLSQSVAAELGDPVDVQIWAYITKRVVEEEAKGTITPP